MKSRVVGIIKFEAARTHGPGTGLGLNLSGSQDGLSLEKWLSALVGERGEEDREELPRWKNQRMMLPPRHVRANLAQLAEELDREYQQLSAG